MLEKMKTTRKALPHTQFAPEPVRRANPIVVVVVGDEIPYRQNLSTLATKTLSSRPESGPIAHPICKEDSRQGNPDYNPCAHAP